MKGYKIVDRKFSTTVWPLLAAAAILCAGAPANAAEKEPNIVFMLVDTLGYGELGAYGGGILRGAPHAAYRQVRKRRHAAAQLQWPQTSRAPRRTAAYK